MARPKGRRNEGYDERRTALAQAIIPRLVEPDGVRTSLRELASVAGVSVPTLRHYFSDRDGLVRASFTEIGKLGLTHMQQNSVVQEDDLLTDVTAYLVLLVQAWTQLGVGPMMTAGITEGLHHPQLGPSFVDALLEPLLQVGERRIEDAQRKGWIEPDADPRAASLMLVGPVVMALLHQGPLSGSQCRPLDLEALARTTAARFARAYGSAPTADSAATQPVQ